MAKDQSTPSWLEWAREIQALSQTGLTYSESEYATQRYTRLQEIAAEITAAHTHLEYERIHQAFKLEPGYATTKVDVRGAIVQDNKILLVQEAMDQCWCMPGGWADVGDKPSDMIVREIWEESGFKAEAKKIIGVYDANRREPMEFFHAYKIVFLCEIISGEATPSHETLAVDFFDFDNLPPLSLNRTNERHLSDIQAFLNNPKETAVFD